MQNAVNLIKVIFFPFIIAFSTITCDYEYTLPEPDIEEIELWPTQGIYIVKSERTGYLQGSWYSFTDQEYASSDDTDADDAENDNADRSKFGDNGGDPIEDKMKIDPKETKVISTKGIIRSGNDKNWGVGFGFELCYVRAGDNKPPSVNDGTDDKNIPFAHEHTYSLRYCPFNEEIYKQFKGIKFDLTENNHRLEFGKLEVQFKQLGESDSSIAKCFVYQDNKYSVSGETKCNYEYAEATNSYHVEVRADLIGANVDRITAIHFQVDSWTESNENTNVITPTERSFAFSMENLKGILEIPKIVALEKKTSDNFYTGPMECPKLEQMYSYDAGDLCKVDDAGDLPPINSIEWQVIDKNFCRDQQDDNGDGLSDDIEIMPDKFEIMKKEVTVEELYEFYQSNEWPWENTQDKEASLISWKVCDVHEFHNNLNDKKKSANLKERAANCVDYCTAYRFCKWIGGRLPFEDEWMCAARSGSDEKSVEDCPSENDYPWKSDGIPSCAVAVMSKDNNGGYRCGKENPRPETGCTKRGGSGNTILDLCDMAGNVYEWTSTAFRETDDKNDIYGFKVIKGGSIYSEYWPSVGEKEFYNVFKIGSRSMEHSFAPYNWGRVGFRCIRDYTDEDTKAEL